jgi:hypothetical protein
MAEMYHVGDKDKNQKLELKEFIRGMLEHPVTSKIIRIKKIGKFKYKFYLHDISVYFADNKTYFKEKKFLISP